MTDMISKASVLEEARSLDSFGQISRHTDVYVVDVEDIKNLPTLEELDVVPVVRCKDCTHWKPDGTWSKSSLTGERYACGKCSFLGYTNERFFCASGDRRGDANVQT